MQIKNKQLRKLMEVTTDFDEDGFLEPITEEDLDNSIYNPANDAYLEMTAHLQGRMTNLARVLRPSQLAMIKLADQGHKTAYIAAQTRTCPATVLRTLKLPRSVDLLNLMRKYSQLIEGVTSAMKDAMLYRIAVANEINDPRISIAAIAELNKTEHNDRTHQLNQKQGGTSNQTVIVQLGDARLKPSSLDAAPKHLMRDIN